MITETSAVNFRPLVDARLFERIRRMQARASANKH